MPFEPRLWDSNLITRIDKFLNTINIDEWYKKYDWNNDSWNNGFPDIFELEMIIGEAVKNKSLTVNHIIKVAKWGGNNRRIECDGTIDVPIYDGHNIAKWVEEEPERYIDDICSHIKYFGPTYGSKLLRFALPSEYGAIDTRLVRVFGSCDDFKNCINLLNLKASHQNKEKRWSIAKNKSQWPSEYGTWINVLRYIAKQMNENDVNCPHPDCFVETKLRDNGLWCCADVEMALFSYASYFIKTKNKGSANGCAYESTRKNYSLSNY
ncbi:hypothetical protein [Methanococcoides sp. LMO-2]|uniref:Uncharacterized protein n=1 Tax=Methanococcoides cohabitans TaxID=3136559 RepID=A0ABU9KPU1_9EURY